MLTTIGEIFDGYEPGSGETWYHEFQWLERHHQDQMTELKNQIIEARGIMVPILLGDDGRVWDGHHRIYAAWQLGYREVPTVYNDREGSCSCSHYDPIPRDVGRPVPPMIIDLEADEYRSEW